MTRGWNVNLLIVSILPGLVLGPLLGGVTGLIAFSTAASLFYSMWIPGFMLVMISTLIGAFVGWSLGGYGPSLLLLRLPAVDRIKHFFVSIALVTAEGLTLLVLTSALIIANPEFVSGLLMELFELLGMLRI